MTQKRKSLVCEHLEMVSGQILQDYPKVISDYVKGQKGVYALYKGEKLYYVGLAVNMRSRLQAHVNDRHKGNWDYFSVYLAKDDKHLKELETLVIRIADPKGNAVKGRFYASENIKPKLEKAIKQDAVDKIGIILGHNRKKKKVRSEKSHQGPRKESRSSALTLTGDSR